MALRSTTLQRGAQFGRSSSSKGRAVVVVRAAHAAHPTATVAHQSVFKTVHSHQDHLCHNTTSTSSPAMFQASRHDVPPTPQEQHDSFHSFADQALATFVESMRSQYSSTNSGVPMELLRVGQLASACVKEAASKHLQVAPRLNQEFQADCPRAQLAARILLALNSSNTTPGLRFLALDPAVGVPLVGVFIEAGLADPFGQPVYRQQEQQTRVMGLQQWLQFTIKDPSFVGRSLEDFWGDSMTVEPDAFPVVSATSLGSTILQPPLLARMLAGFPAGRQLLHSMNAACADIGLAWGCAEAPESDVSLFSLVGKHPCAALGVLLLSQPDTPLATFLRARAAEGYVAAGVILGGQGSRGSATEGLLRKLQDSWEQLVMGAGAGGPVWRVGCITAVGAGDEGGSSGLPLFVPAYERRQQGVAAKH